MVCSAPPFPGDIEVGLTLGGGGKTNGITASFYTLTRGATLAEHKEGAESPKSPDGFATRLLSPHDVVYGQQNAVVLLLEVDETGLPEEAECLVRARGLPLLAAEAERLAAGVLGDGLQKQYLCVLGEATLARLESAGIEYIEVAVGKRASFLPVGAWPAVALRERVTIGSAHPQRLVLHPAQRHEVVLNGNFQTLVEDSCRKVGS